MGIFNALMQTDTADRRPSFLNVDVPIFTSTPVIRCHEEQIGIERTSEDENSTYAVCILSIFNSMNDLEKEVREIKRDVSYTLELKIDELKSMLVLMFNNITNHNQL